MAKTNRERVAEYRARLKEKGGREIVAYLDEEAAAVLDALLAHFGEGVTPVVRRALLALQKEIKGT